MSRSPGNTQTAERARKKLSQSDAASTVLKKARKAMSCKKLVDAMAKHKLWASPGGKTPDATLYSAILRDLRSGKDVRFKKPPQAGSTPRGDTGRSE